MLLCLGMRRFGFIAVLLAAAFVVCSCSKQNSGNSTSSAQPPRGAAQDPGGGTVSGATAPQMPGAPMSFEKPPITDIGELVNSTNNQGLWTRTVNLSGVTVQRRLGSFILVGPDKNHVVPVQLGGQSSKVEPGQKVNVGGMIDPLGKDKSQWNGNPDVQKDLSSYSIFIRATTITLAASQ